MRTSSRSPEVHEHGLAGLEDLALEVGVGDVGQLAGHLVSCLKGQLGRPLYPMRWRMVSPVTAWLLLYKVKYHEDAITFHRLRIRIRGTPSAASTTIPPDIFDSPTRRSRNVIGTSTTRNPARTARYVIST